MTYYIFSPRSLTFTQFLLSVSYSHFDFKIC